MRILVTGASGMLGSTLVRCWRERHAVFATGRAGFVAPATWTYRAFDLATRDHAPLIEWAQPDVIVHCAAWTAVDACESDPDRALDINGRTVGRLLDAAPGARMIYISTDAVFGDRSQPLSEDAVPEPVNVYGRSKLLGELLLHERDAGVAVRTTVVGWNVDPKKQSFAEWIVRSLQAGTRTNLFRDGLFTPIAASLLADELEILMTDPRRGVWHVTSRESISKHDFGVRLCVGLGLRRDLIHEALVADARFAARRSADQRLAVARYERDFGRRLPTIQETIDALVYERTNAKDLG